MVPVQLRPLLSTPTPTTPSSAPTPPPSPAATRAGPGPPRSITRRCWARRCSTRRGSAICMAARSRCGSRRSCRRPTPVRGRCRSRSANRGRRTSTAASVQFADTVSWSQRYPHAADGRERRPSHVRRYRQRTGPGGSRHLHVPQHYDGPVRAADAGRRAAVLGAGQLRHHQLRVEAVDVGGVRAGQHSPATTTSRSTRASVTTVRR